MTDELEYRRRNIDRIDRTIVALILERLRVGREIGAIKRDRSAPTRVPEREAEVIDLVQRAAEGKLSAEAAQRIFTAIIEETVAVQDKERGHE